MFDYRALYEIQLQVSVDFLRVVQFSTKCRYMYIFLFHYQHYSGFDQNCTSDIPHGSVYKPCPSGHVCDMECNDGYRARALAGDDWLACLSGEWTLSATKYDPTITPQTVCVPEGKQS